MAKAMTKSQVVSHLAEHAGIQKKAAASVLEEIANLATKECKKGGQFVIPGLGKAVKANSSSASLPARRGYLCGSRCESSMIPTRSPGNSTRFEM